MTDLLLGATPIDGRRTQFRVWAPRAARLTLDLPGTGERIAMERDTGGRHAAVAAAPAGTLYQFCFDDGRVRPDPASRHQPRGVHGPSMVVAIDPPAGPIPLCAPLSHHVLYELHVATFTREGTFDAVIPRLDGLRELGVTAIELMPIGEFPGARNWGYDGVCLFAAQRSYGGVAGLRRLVDACHERGMALIVDVVYNHLGPEGNYLGDFGPYFTDRYKTPWGRANNFDGPGSDQVREFFIQNALHWTIACGADGLRLDAVHAIHDRTARPFLQELRERVRAAAEQDGRRILLIAESHDNDPRLVRAPEVGGVGLDGVWNDDYHHAVRTALTGDRAGYYAPFGSVSQIAKCLRDRYVFAGEHSTGFGRRHGAPAPDVEHGRFVVFTQNHDQVGNRPMGDRLDEAAGPEAARLAAALVLLSPFTPMLWMGEEHAEASPFLYFVSHSDPELVEAVRKGRREEFPELHGGAEPPDPQSESTFLASKIDWTRAADPPHAARRALYRDLIALRRELGLGRAGVPLQAHAWEDDRCVAIVYGRPAHAIVAANLGEGTSRVRVPLEAPTGGAWAVRIDTEAAAYGGRGGGARAEAAGCTVTIELPGRCAAAFMVQGAAA